MFDENKVFDGYFELPDGYQVQLMVLRDYPSGKGRRGKPSVFRSRVWIGHASEPEPLVYRAQEHPELQVAIDACYSLLLIGAEGVVGSLAAMAAIQQQVHHYFSGVKVPG